MPPDTAEKLKSEIKYLEIPNPEESHVRLSPKARQIRQQVDDLLEGRFPEMYELARQSHEDFGLIDKGGHFPTAEEVALAFDSEELKTASKYQDPALIISPPRRSQNDLMRAISDNTSLIARKGPLVCETNQLAFDSGPEYRAYISESAARMFPAHDMPGAPLISRIDHKVARRGAEEWGMSPDLYSLLLMQSITKGELIDRHNFTIFDGEPVVAGHYVPVGHCRKGRPTLEWFPSNVSVALSRRGRFRRVLGGRTIY